jgi:hypothetical protein
MAPPRFTYRALRVSILVVLDLALQLCYLGGFASANI